MADITDEFKKKVYEYVTLEMIGEKWFPKEVPLTVEGKVDFAKVESLWNQEAIVRTTNYIVNENLTSTNIDEALAKLRARKNAGYPIRPQEEPKKWFGDARTNEEILEDLKDEEYEAREEAKRKAQDKMLAGLRDEEYEARMAEKRAEAERLLADLRDEEYEEDTFHHGM